MLKMPCGPMMPWLAVILDHNFIDDLSPLVGLARLHHLSIRGGRVDKARPLLQTLSTLPELEHLDLRVNPLTLGFYPSSSYSTPSLTSGPAAADHRAEDAKFRRCLPDEWLARRSAYRALVIDTCPRLSHLDGLCIRERQRAKAKDLVETFANLHVS